MVGENADEAVLTHRVIDPKVPLASSLPGVLCTLMADHAPCQVCGTTDRDPFIQTKGMDLYRCRNCAVVFMDPMPDPAAVEDLYSDAYDGATKGYFAKVKSKLRRSRGRVRQLQRYVKSGRFLDVGTNGGFMAKTASDAGYDAWGIEPDPISVAYAREHYPEIHVFQGFIEEFVETPDGAEPFDAVYCSEVLEHVPDVNTFVGAIARATKPGGVLYLTTPDIAHWRVPANVLDWDSFFPPSHCIYFTPSSLTQLLSRHGFSIFRKRLAFKPGIKVFARRL